MSHDKKYDAPEFYREGDHRPPADAQEGGGENSTSPGEPGAVPDGDTRTPDEWPGRQPSTPHRAPTPAPEFTNLAFACNECGRDVPEDDAGPSCGAHILHVECAPWFGCRECYLIRSEIP